MFSHSTVRALRAPLLTAFALIAASASAHGTCAASVAELRGMLQDHSFPLRWEEIGMNDARPLLVNIEDRDGTLFISFVKSAEGLLAEGPASVCRVEGRLQARFRKDGLQLGTAASLVLKTALRAGVAVALERTGPGRLRIGTVGWRGDFVPGASGVGLKIGAGTP